MSRDASLKDVPAAVAGSPEKRTGIVLAANYNARHYGVKTAMTLHEAYQKCPELITVPPDHKYYKQRSDEVMKRLLHYSPIVEQNSIDEAWLDMTGTEKLLGPAYKVATTIMNDLENHLDLWCSIGISSNKFLAKMAADMKKPLGITELWPKDVEKKLWPLPAQKMYGVGSKTFHKLKLLNINTIGDIANFSATELLRVFGAHGLSLHQKANGIDPSNVVPNSKDDMKSIGRSVTLESDAYKAESVRNIFFALAEDVAMQGRQHNKKGTVVQIILKSNDFKSITRQVTVEPTYYTKDLYDHGFQLLQKNWPPHKGVRLIGISLTGFCDHEQGQQMSIFDTLNHSPKKQTLLSLKKPSHTVDDLLDKIRKKHGSDSISRASLLRKKK